MAEKHETLGNNVVPLNYSIAFEPNLKTFRFRGAETITVSVKRPTNVIRLNAKELTIRNAYIAVRGSRQKARVTKGERDQTISLTFKDRVSGSAKIEVKFEGRHNDGLYGFYRSRYAAKGKAAYNLSTQFEAANARAAFPCFDEPEFKATFDVSLVIDKNLDAISNTEPKSTVQNGKSKKTVTFRTTPKMSSYLLYLGVGRYDYLNGRLGKIRIRVVTTPGMGAYAGMAMKYTKRFIDYYERYFGIKYPLNKMDMIAVPDFAVGAMENWGAITFRDTALLADEKNVSAARRQRIAEVIAHELAHQWFGDLVTMRWWDDTWLNESFATFMSYKAIDDSFPKWNIMTQYLQDAAQIAYSADELRSTHPINVEVKNVGAIEGVFDRISYEKGGTVLKMIEDYVGKEVFRQGLHLYLKRNAYSNATKNDLWESIDKAARIKRRKVRAREVASKWINRSGYPIVTVYKSDFALHISQRRYTITETPPSREETWPIPLHYMTASGQEGFLLFTRTDQDISIEQAKWVKLNRAQSGFYRVRYPDEMLCELGAAIKGRKMSSSDAWGVEFDLFSLVRSGRAPVSTYLNFVRDYCMESQYPLNDSVSMHLGWLHMMLYGTKLESHVAHVSREFHLNVLKGLGWRKRNSDSNTDSIIRGKAIGALGVLGHRQAMARAAKMFRDYRKDKDLVDSNLRNAVLGTIAWNGGKREFTSIIKLYKKEKFPEEKVRLLQTLGIFRKEELVRKALDFSNSREVRLQDSGMVAAVASGNPDARGILLPWTERNWQRFMSTYDSGTHMLGMYLENLSTQVDADARADIGRFFKNRRNRRADIERTISQTLERIEANINFMKRNE